MKMYRSGIGEIKSYNDWREWAIMFYKDAFEKNFDNLPDDWFRRATNVLKLEEVEIA